MIDLRGHLTFRKTDESDMWIVVDPNVLTNDNVDEEGVFLEAIRMIFVLTSDGRWTQHMSMSEYMKVLDEEGVEQLEQHRVTLEDLLEIARMNSL